MEDRCALRYPASMTTPLVLPTMQTQRLTLEPLGLTHSAGMFRLWSEPAVCRYAGPAADAWGAPIPLPASTPADSDRILDFFVRSAAAADGCRWAMLEVASGRFVGAVGFNHLRPTAELAYHLHPDAWGRGLMCEAALAALGWLTQTSEVRDVVAHIDPGNVASIRLAERLGLQRTDGDAYRVRLT